MRLYRVKVLGATEGALLNSRVELRRALRKHMHWRRFAHRPSLGRCDAARGGGGARGGGERGPVAPVGRGCRQRSVLHLNGQIV